MREAVLRLVVNNSAGEPSFTEQADGFARYLLVQRGFKRSTIQNYRKLIFKFLTESDGRLINQNTISAYIEAMYHKGRSSSHITNTSLAIERYMEFIGRPLKLGRPRKQKRIIKDTLSEAEGALILAATKNIREKAILALLAYSGIRNDELCSARVCDLDLGGNAIRVINGKGSKDRAVCIDGDCTQILIRYLSEYPRSQDSYLFTTLRTNRKYSSWCLRYLVKVVAARAKIKKRVHPHLFRHSLATTMIKRGADIIAVKDQLGHSFIDTTMIYVRSRFQHVQVTYNKCAPSYL